MKENELREALDLEFSTVRVLVLMELGPLSNKYTQIMLNEKQAKSVRDCIWLRMKPCKCGAFAVPTDGEEYKLPDIKAEYSDEEIREAGADDDHVCPIGDNEKGQ